MSAMTLAPAEDDFHPEKGLRLLDSFFSRLCAVGYSQQAARRKQLMARSFVDWLRRRRVSVVKADDSHVAGFLRRAQRRSESRLVHERPAIRGFVRHVRSVVGTSETGSPTPVSASAALEGDYVAYLRRERGLSERSIQVYQPYVKDFIATWTARTGSDSPAALNAQIARSFLLDRIQGRSGEYARLLATVIRSYLRFVFLRGDTAVDLSLAVPTVRLPGHASPPSSFSPEEVEQILSSVDLSTAGGRRDHAILLLLARLGLRAGEVVGLELEDVHWRAAEIVIHGKGRTLDRLPLPSDVGEALSRYIREDRDPSATRRVFLRKIPPRVGLAGPAAVGHVVRAALARAGVQAPCRGAAHLFRHSLATRMIRQGGSLGEISQILRHRSSAVTEVYAKVAFESLRAVSRPWPGSEDGR